MQINALVLLKRPLFRSRGHCRAPSRGNTSGCQGSFLSNNPVLVLKMKKEEEGRGRQYLIRWPSDEEGTLSGDLESNKTCALEPVMGEPGGFVKQLHANSRIQLQLSEQV
ncbi:hypothetical protein AMECASPLE_026829 [Ameca splendens]|uniref:Uncharacterized protein n=1 Tax=Ameca splendens TaxID=208324 RepID=A0ABV0Y550_9TELE